MLYAPNNRQNSWGENWELWGETDESTNTIKDFNIHLLSQMDRSSRQKMIKDEGELNLLNQLDITNINSTSSNNIIQEYIHFSLHELSPKMEHILGHKTHLNKFKRIETI